MIVMKQVLNLFGAAMHESLTRTLGNVPNPNYCAYSNPPGTLGKYLEATSGCLSNKNKSEWEKDIAARMVCTNNAAEGTPLYNPQPTAH
jgi:hypothetical protein